VLIDAAMQLSKESNMTDYILNSAAMIAEQRLMARTEFHLDSRQYQRFLDTLERPVQHKPRLRHLMTEPSVGLRGRTSQTNVEVTLKTMSRRSGVPAANG